MAAGRAPEADEAIAMLAEWVRPRLSLLHRRPAAMVALLLPAGTFTVLDKDDQYIGVAGEGDVVLWRP